MWQVLKRLLIRLAGPGQIQGDDNFRQQMLPPLGKAEVMGTSSVSGHGVTSVSKASLLAQTNPGSLHLAKARRLETAHGEPCFASAEERKKEGEIIIITTFLKSSFFLSFILWDPGLSPYRDGSKRWLQVAARHEEEAFWSSV